MQGLGERRGAFNRAMDGIIKTAIVAPRHHAALCRPLNRQRCRRRLHRRDSVGQQWCEGDIFASQHGSWNRSVRAGYEVIRVPLHQTGHAAGEYEDFLTGFVLPDGNVWGRPVGTAIAPDGSLLVSDDGSNSIWRVSHTRK